MIQSVEKLPEVWLRGNVPGVPPLLQPAAHALLQSKEEVRKYTTRFPEKLLWEQPAGRASVGFHLQHLTGVLDRMLTYAKGDALAEAQFSALKKEGVQDASVKIEALVTAFEKKVEEAIETFRSINEDILTQSRTVGRKQLPSTVIGLFFHAAEHSQRHVGQLLVTVSILFPNLK